MTLDPSLIARVRDMLDRGLGYRQIARLLDGDVSKSTVSDIAAHRHAYDPKRPHHPTRDVTAGTVAVCPGCHYRVTLPCQICRARAYRAAARPNFQPRPKPQPHWSQAMPEPEWQVRVVLTFCHVQAKSADEACAMAEEWAACPEADQIFGVACPERTPAHDNHPQSFTEA